MKTYSLLSWMREREREKDCQNLLQVFSNHQNKESLKRESLSLQVILSNTMTKQNSHPSSPVELPKQSMPGEAAPLSRAKIGT
jgi:hypothetical protein